MKRRRVLSSFLGIVAGLSGCIAINEDSQNNPTGTPTSTGDGVDTSVEERVKECETDYIGTQLIDDENESITDRSGPIIVATDTRSDGWYLELETEVGTVRSTEGEPDEHVDYVVKAAYLVTENEVYRTEGFDIDGDPRDGTVLEC